MKNATSAIVIDIRHIIPTLYFLLENQAKQWLSSNGFDTNYWSQQLAKSILINFAKEVLDFYLNWTTNACLYDTVERLTGLFIKSGVHEELSIFLCSNYMSYIESVLLMLDERIYSSIKNDLWGIWSIELNLDSLFLVNRGDYRIEEWANDRVKDGKFGNMRYEVLRS